MIYTLTKNFQRLTESSGTIQNTSSCYMIEISDRQTAGSGIMLYPRQKFSFSGTTLYARCIGGGGVELRVVPFLTGATGSGGGSSVIDDSTVATQDELDHMMDDIFNGTASTDSDDDSDVNAMIDDVFGN